MNGEYAPALPPKEGSYAPALPPKEGAYATAPALPPKEGAYTTPRSPLVGVAEELGLGETTRVEMRCPGEKICPRGDEGEREEGRGRGKYTEVASNNKRSMHVCVFVIS